MKFNLKKKNKFKILKKEFTTSCLAEFFSLKIILLGAWIVLCIENSTETEVIEAYFV